MEDEVREALGDKDVYIRRLERTLKRLNKENEELRADIVELRRMCKKHYDTVQNLLRYEAKVEVKEARATYGQVAEGGASFEIPQSGDVKLLSELPSYLTDSK